MRSIKIDDKAFARHREVLTRWAVEHGIAPEVLPVPTTLRVDHEQMTVTVDVFLRRNGCKYVNRATGEPARGVLTVPLVASFPTIDDGGEE